MILKKQLSICLLLILLLSSTCNYSFADEEIVEENNQEQIENEEPSEEDLLPPEIDGLRIYSESAILMEQSTGKILFEKDAYARKYPASTTKVLTAIIAIEKCDLEETAVASERAIGLIKKGYSTARIQVGEEFTIRQLLEVLMLQSANEAANIIAEHISGSVEEFANLMNEKAQEIGCKDSHFVNPNGMHDENHYSTAYDLAMITRYSMENETYREIVLEKECVLPFSDLYKEYDEEKEEDEQNKERRFPNTNKLLLKGNTYYYPYCTGGKTGFTTPAKNCYIATSDKDGFELISVILHAESTIDGKSARYTDTLNLFNYGYDKYNKEDIFEEYGFKIESKEISILNGTVVDIDGIINTISSPENENIIRIVSIVMIIMGSIVMLLGIFVLKLSKKGKHNLENNIYNFNIKK